jgi:hypothetical protein
MPFDRYPCERCCTSFEFQHQLTDHDCPGSVEAGDAFEKLTEAEANRRTYLVGVAVFVLVLLAGAVLSVAGGVAADLALPTVGVSLDIVAGVCGAGGLVGLLMWSVREFTRQSSFEKVHEQRRIYSQLKNKDAAKALAIHSATRNGQAASSSSAVSGVQSVQLERGQ